MIKTEVEKWLCESLNVKAIQIQSSSEEDSDFSITPKEIKRLEKEHGLNAEKIFDLLFIETGRNPYLQVSLKNNFVNLRLSKETLNLQMKLINEDLKSFLNTPSPDQTVIIDYSGPNIAKPFSVGHLRSTVIGQANYNIHKVLGYEVCGVNHIGDWGTQFGKLIYAVKTWGNEEIIAKDPINELVKLYQKFHEEAEKDPEINKEASVWFRKLELHDKEAEELWKKCITWSFKEFDRLYGVLGVKIDNTTGESFYADKTDEVIRELQEKGLLTESQGAQIVELGEMPPAIIQKTNESTLYIARDLAAIKYRIKEYKPNEIIYHVGNDQNLHFRQLFEIVKKLGWAENVSLTFAGHGMMRMPEGKMSTRKGRVVLLDDLLQEAKNRVGVLFSEKEKSGLEGKEMELAVSAVKYADLSSNRLSDVIFSFDRLIDLKGNSALYLQYTYARIESLIREYKSKYGGETSSDGFAPEADELVRLGVKFKEVLVRSANNSSPNILCEFIYNFAGKFNSFYEKNRIITDDKLQSTSNIKVVYFARNIIGQSLDLLALNKFEKI